MALSALERLRRFYHQFSGEDQVLIVINADPDAIASAMAVKRLLWRKVSNVGIAHVNVISRPDNLAMIRLLNVRLEHLQEVDLTDFSRFVIVDSQPDHHEDFATFKADVIIDHHPDSTTPEDGAFVDIRPKYGANASIMTEYVRAARIKPSAKLATGLFYAIKTDTNNFQRKTLIEDVRAFQYLFRYANIDLVRKIDQAEITLEFLEDFKRALQNRVLRRRRIFAHLGKVDNPDVCVLIADFFMRIQSISWSIVSGIYDRKLVIILRNDGLRKNAGKVARESFGRFGSAGGHKSTARAEIEIKEIKSMVNSCRDLNVMQHWIIQQVEKKAGRPGKA
jgi:nanoRNase/pAp phosphatase (c-di-AMP/oligoRNAs hydrolase)